MDITIDAIIDHAETLYLDSIEDGADTQSLATILKASILSGIEDKLDRMGAYITAGALRGQVRVTLTGPKPTPATESSNQAGQGPEGPGRG